MRAAAATWLLLSSLVVAHAAHAAAPGAGAGAGTVLHPGDVVQLVRAACTLNFLWEAPDGARYFGTAGHCARWSHLGAAALDGSGRRIGRLVYRSLNDRSDDATRDFALIEIRPGVPVSPQIRNWGGPTGSFAGFTTTPSWLCFYGHGDVVGAVAPARQLLSTAMTQRHVAYVEGVTNGGDSGSAVIDSRGRAIGWFVSDLSSAQLPLVSPTGGIEAGQGLVIRITPAVITAEHALHLHLRLVTAPRTTDCSSPLATPRRG